MKIKIGDQIFDAEKELIMLKLTAKDKENISNMHPEAGIFAIFPDNIDPNEVACKMKEFKDQE